MARVGLLTMTMFCLKVDRSFLDVFFFGIRSLVVNFPLYCVDWVVVTGDALLRPIEQNSSLFHKFHSIELSIRDRRVRYFELSAILNCPLFLSAIQRFSY